MPMRLSGLMSGMDTESIIQQLVEAKKTKVTKAVKAQKSLKYKQDAWKDLNKQVLNLYNKSLSNMRFESSFIKKVTKVSNSSVVSVITGEGAMNSVQSLEINQLAKTGYLTGGEIQDTVEITDEDGNKKEVAVTGKTTLGQLGLEGSGKIQVKTSDGTTSIELGSNTTIDSFISALKSAGLSANFDQANGRIHIASKSSGTKNDFSITAVDGKGFEALETLKLSNGYGDEKLVEQYKSIINGYDDGSTVKARQEARQKALGEYWTSLKDKRQGILEGLSADALGKVNHELNSSALQDKGITLETVGTGDDEKLVVKKNGAEVDWASLTDSDWETIDTAISAAVSSLKADSENAVLTDEEKQEALDLAASFDAWTKNQDELTATENNFVGSSTVAGGGVQLDTNGLPKLAQSVLDGIEADVKAEADNAQAVIDKLTQYDIKDTDTEEEKAQKEAAIAKMGQKTQAQDAEIYLNGVKYTSDRNTFEVNGLTLTVNAKTEKGESVTITTEDDTDGIYDMIKGFLKEYNELINKMDKMYNAESSKGYDPLTDEEKDAMSDSAIEEWETKIKDSILRKDSVLGTFSGVLKKMMMEGVEVNGKMMYLSNFGINTLNYFSAPDNERNAYHIDGDPDDENTSGNADKLKSMIANDPDTVVSFFTQLSKKMYNEMFEQMKAKEGYSSAMTVYDDKKMQTDYDDYTQKIKELEKKLADYEDKWYAKFAAMETALAKMQNNASAVTSLLGG